MTTEHNTDVRLQRAYIEWRPECTCGWVGSYHKAKSSADTDAQRHRLAALPGTDKEKPK